MSFFDGFDDDVYDSPMFCLVDPNEILPLDTNSGSNLHPPPTLVPRVSDDLHHHLEKLSQRRRERLKARMSHTSTDVEKICKKLTSRERQVELEKQVVKQTQLKEDLLQKINDLEQKCQKVRDILENIVKSSPEYNSKIIKFLELVDRPENV